MRQILFLTIICCFAVSCQQGGISDRDIFPRQIKSDSLLILKLDSAHNLARVNQILCKHKKKNFNVPNGYIRLNNNLDIPFFQSVWSECYDPGVLSCFKERTFIRIEKDSFISVLGNEKFNILNLERHFTERFLNPKSMYLSDTRFTVITFEIPSDGDIDVEEVESKISIISTSYTNFFKKNISKDSIGFYREKYPFILMFERPYDEIVTVPPPPQPERIVIKD